MTILYSQSVGVDSDLRESQAAPKSRCGNPDIHGHNFNWQLTVAASCQLVAKGIKKG